MSNEEILKSLLERAVVSERASRRRAVIYTLIPIFMAAVLIGVTWQQVASATAQLNNTNTQLSAAGMQLSTTSEQLSQSQQQMAGLKDQLSKANLEVETLKKQSDQYQVEIEKLSAQVSELQTQRENLNQAIEQIQQQLYEATSLKRYVYDGDVMMALKQLGNLQLAAQARLFENILDMQNKKIPWKAGGISIDKGFDSPGFAAYILSENKLLNQPLVDAHYQLINILTSVNRPNVGDIIFYKTGYTMFYFLNDMGEPFVIGMTPLGILALKYDFAPVIAIGQVNYR